MDFHGNINLQQNLMQRMVVQTENNFPETPIVGRVVFKDAKLYVCVAINNLIPVWLPLTNKIDTYVHTEAVAATTWTVTHNLNTTIPLLQVYNAAGEMLIPDNVVPTSNNVMTVTFNTAIAGTAVVLFGDLIPQSGIGVLEPSIAWSVADISAATYDSKSYNTTGATVGMHFKPDGTKLFVVNQSVTGISQHTLSTPWDISTASNDAINYIVSTQSTSPLGVSIKPDGTKMYVLDNNRTVYQYTLSTAWDITSASYDSLSGDVYAAISVQNIEITEDGTKLYMVSTFSDSVHQYSMSTAWDISSLSYDNKSFVVGGTSPTPRDVFLDPTGSQMFIIDDNDSQPEKVFLYDLGTAFDVTTSVLNSSFEYTHDATPGYLELSTDGTKMYVGSLSNIIYQYSTNI